MGNNQPENISPDVLGILQRQQSAAQMAQQVFQQTINAAFEQYGLSPEDQINLQTGEITRVAQRATQETKTAQPE